MCYFILANISVLILDADFLCHFGLLVVKRSSRKISNCQNNIYSIVFEDVFDPRTLLQKYRSITTQRSNFQLGMMFSTTSTTLFPKSSRMCIFYQPKACCGAERIPTAAGHLVFIWGDYERLNAQTISDRYPILLIQDFVPFWRATSRPSGKSCLSFSLASVQPSVRSFLPALLIWGTGRTYDSPATWFSILSRTSLERPFSN